MGEHQRCWNQFGSEVLDDEFVVGECRDSQEKRCDNLSRFVRR